VADENGEMQIVDTNDVVVANEAGRKELPSDDAQ
jgi:hypothetical protein